MAKIDALLATIESRAHAADGAWSALPPEAYRSEALLALERERIFRGAWLCSGLAAEIPEPGAYLTDTIDDQPIIVMRGEDGRVRAFSNVCLHRMMRLLEGRGRVRKIACPYHAWTYDLTGRLAVAPHMTRSANFKASDHRLPEVRVEVWEGWIYVTLDPSAPAVADLLAPLHGLVAPYAMAGYVPVATQDHVWATNWKLLTENFMEGYHLPVAHRRTVGAWMPVEDTWFPNERHAGFTCQTFTKGDDATYGRAHPDNKRLEGDQRFTSVMPTVFPSHMYVLAPDHFWYLSLRPKGVGEVRIRFGMALAPEVAAAQADLDAYVRPMVAFFERVNLEDKAVVEQLYANAAAPLARSGPLSWLERELNDFQCYLADRLIDGPEV
jgi:phenylpropionate dioxygenase-like ring-hydroxylating dioxygenase large terminal subunit